MNSIKASSEEFLKHLDILQATISRLATNSFAIRGWSVTLIAGLFALAAKDSNPKLAVIGYFPIFVFWILDAHYLALERQFRTLFDWVALHDERVPSFSLDTKIVGNYSQNWLTTCFSGPLLVFHGVLLITVTVVMLLFRSANQ